MAKREERSGSSVTTAAEIIGRAAGQAAGAVDAFRSRHPHPIAEVGEALTAGQEALSDLTAQARAGSAAVVAKTKDAAQRAQVIVRRARRRAVKTLARVTRTTKKAVASAKKVARKRRSKRSKATKPGSAGPNAATRRRLQTAHVKRRQAHAASGTRRRQARRDKGR